MRHVFRSRVDTPILLTLLLLPLSLLVVVAFLTQRTLPLKAVLVPITLLLGVCLPVSLLFFTRYVVEGGILRIQHGLFRWTIPLRTISSVTQSNDPASSPALSLDRLRIDYANGKHVLVSPSDKVAFLALLRSLDVPFPAQGSSPQ